MGPPPAPCTCIGCVPTATYPSGTSEPPGPSGRELWTTPSTGSGLRHAGGVPLLREPLPVTERRLLRTAVLQLARNDHRRHIRPVLHVGVPGGPTSTVDDDTSWDHGLRTEIVGAALRALRDPPWVWVTRSGPLSLQDVDAAWLGPTGAAAGEGGGGGAGGGVGGGVVVAARRGGGGAPPGGGPEKRGGAPPAGRAARAGRG